MSIVRSARPHLNYSIVHNDIIEDQRDNANLKARVTSNRERIRRMEEGEL